MTAEDYIQNGLVSMWDGIENTGYGMHDSSATSWKNLVQADSGCNFTVTNGQFADDHLVVTGPNYTTIGHMPSFDIMSFEYVIAIPEVRNGTSSIFYWRFYTGGPFKLSNPWSILRITGGGNGNSSDDNNSYDLKPYIGQRFETTTFTNFYGQNGLYANGSLARP